MKVILVYLGRRGGGPVYSLEVAKRLSKKIDLLAIISQQVENLKEWEKSGLKIYKVSTYDNFFGFLVSFFRFYNFFLFWKEIKKFSPDLIYYPFFHFWLPIINLLSPKIPKVFTLHDPVLHKGERYFLMEVFQNLVIKNSKRIIVLGKNLKKIVIKKGISPENIDVIPHGIFDYYLNIKKTKIEKFQAPHPPTILFFGRILKYKGLETLLRAFPLIKREIPNAQLWIVGSGNLKPYLKFLSKLQGVKVENRWINDEEIADFFTKADLLVCPYEEASQSGVIPLAAAFKMPVIASRVNGLIEQIEDKTTGFLVQPKNIKELASYCILLLKNERKRKQMGENAFNKANREWNWEVVSEKVLESFKKTLI